MYLYYCRLHATSQFVLISILKFYLSTEGLSQINGVFALRLALDLALVSALVLALRLALGLAEWTW